MIAAHVRHSVQRLESGFFSRCINSASVYGSLISSSAFISFGAIGFIYSRSAQKEKKTRKPRAKKETTEATAEKPARKPRAPRKKAVVPTFVIQNSAEDSITYADVVAKVQAAVTVQDVTSLDIYVKAEEGKAYYVVNGEAAGGVDLF